MDNPVEDVCLMGVGRFRENDSTEPMSDKVAQIFVTNFERGSVFVPVSIVGIGNIPIFLTRLKFNLFQLRFQWQNPNAKLILIPREALGNPDHLAREFARLGIKLNINLQI